MISKHILRKFYSESFLSPKLLLKGNISKLNLSYLLLELNDGRVLINLLGLYHYIVLTAKKLTSIIMLSMYSHFNHIYCIDPTFAVYVINSTEIPIVRIIIYIIRFVVKANKYTN